jgi:hypothetical protein
LTAIVSAASSQRERVGARGTVNMGEAPGETSE